MSHQKIAGLHPDSQRLLWAMVYNRRVEPFDNKRPWRQLSSRRLIKRVNAAHMAEGQWVVTALGVDVLQGYAPYLKRIGLNCPPND
jgi:hypothetical protein